MNPKDEQGKIWYNNKFIDWWDAKIHIMSHVIHYGTSIFEGIRCYNTENGPAIFRLNEHIRRFFDSAKIYRMEIPYSFDEIFQACIDVVRENNLKSAYIRFPFLAKAGANYMNSQLIKMEAIADGYTEGIALNSRGLVSEGSGENLFVVREGKIYTPPISSSCLPGITRDSVFKIAKEFNYDVKETEIPREMLYIADELFFSGTAAEISPIRSVDRIVVGEGKRGPITEKIQSRFFEIIESGKNEKYGWLTFIN